jgi:hypothetical protein
VAQASRLNQFESPIHDRHGRIEPILALQLREYVDVDPGVRQQQALPLVVVVAFFFAMPSCEYSCVQGKRMTTIVGVDDIRFWADDEIVDAVDLERMRRAERYQ